MRCSYQRMPVGIGERKHAHLNPTQTVQYYNTTVQIRRQYDDTTTVTAVYYSTSLLLAVGCCSIPTCVKRIDDLPTRSRSPWQSRCPSLQPACVMHHSQVCLSELRISFFLTSEVAMRLQRAGSTRKRTQLSIEPVMRETSFAFFFAFSW